MLSKIEHWAEDFKQPPILWLNGLAGTGKSAIAQTVVDWCDAHDRLVLSCFCSRDAGRNGGPCLIFSTLALQLAEKHSKVRPVLAPVLGDLVYWAVSDQVEKLIVKPLKVVDVPTLIVLDALDESGLDQECQSDILSALGRWVGEIPKVKILVTSRPQTHFLYHFRSPPLSGLVDVLALHDIAPHLVDSDIRLFLKHELSALAARNGMDNWPTAAQLDLLCARAAGLFVFAVATVKFLDRKNTLPSEQYAIIAHSPHDTIHEGTVEDVYGGLSLDSWCISTLQETFSVHLSIDYSTLRSRFAAITLATHPLPPSAIRTLTGSRYTIMYTLMSVWLLLKLHQDPDQPVLPFHKLLPDLLTSPSRCTDKKLYISPGKYHSELALNCLKLMNETLEGALSLQTRNMGSEVDFPPVEIALKYASTSWHVHLAESKEDVITLVPALRHFLENKFKAWLEMLSVLGVTSIAVSARGKTIYWLREGRVSLPSNVP